MSMWNLKRRLESWQIRQELDNERKAILSRTVRNDPALIAPVQVKVIRPFCTEGQRREVGETVTIDRNTALSLQATGRCQLA